MTAKELFVVGVRLVGLVAALEGLPAILQMNYLAAVPGVAGLVLLTQPELIARLCYPTDSREKALREKVVPKDFRDD